MNKLFIMIGLPGSGKSTFAKNYLLDSQEDTTMYISRDEIRYSLLGENDNYFSKEEEVFATFIQKINQYLKSGYNVIADSTCLSEKSRLKLLSKVNLNMVEVNAVFMDTPLEQCYKNNDKRYNTKAYVPVQRIQKMYESLTVPTLEENKKVFNKIFTVYPNYDVTIKMQKDEFNNEIFYV